MLRTQAEYFSRCLSCLISTTSLFTTQHSDSSFLAIWLTFLLLGHIFYINSAPRACHSSCHTGKGASVYLSELGLDQYSDSTCHCCTTRFQKAENELSVSDQYIVNESNHGGRDTWYNSVGAALDVDKVACLGSDAEVCQVLRCVACRTSTVFR
jgi:hypothetical protein